MDWTLADGMKLFGEHQSIIANPSKVTKYLELPDFYDEVQAKLINNDFFGLQRTRPISLMSRKNDMTVNPSRNSYIKINVNLSMIAVVMPQSMLRHLEAFIYRGYSLGNDTNCDSQRAAVIACFQEFKLEMA